MSKKNKSIKIMSLLLSLILGMTGIIYIYSYLKKASLIKSPFDGSQITYSSNADDFEVALHDNDEKLEEKINEIRKNNGNSKKIACILYSNLLENKGLLDSEKKNLEKFCQYFVDNKYLDYENVCRKLATFIINENDESLLEENIGAAYYEDNSITFATQAERDNSMPHELFHCIENENLSYEEYAWFIEGLVCTLHYEYFNNELDGNYMQVNFIRALCEIVDPDVLFKVSATGEMEHLIEALKKKGISEKKITQFCSLCKDYQCADSLGSEGKDEICIDIADCLVDMYVAAYNDTDSVSDLFYNILERITDPSITTPYDYYYFNGSKKSENEQKTFSVNKEQLFIFKKSNKIIS